MKRDEKEKSSIWFLMVFGIGIIVLIYFEVYKKNSNFYLEEAFKINLEQSYKGIIKDKYLDKMNHNSPKIILTDEKTIALNGFFWDKMQIGDSISKIKGDSVIEIFRNGVKIKLDITPFYENIIQKKK